jgi:hypothetical protein
VAITHTCVTTKRFFRASEIASLKQRDRAALASLDWCPDLSGSGNSDAEADRGDSREELHACTSVVLEQSNEFLTLDPTNLYTAASRLMKPFGQELIQSFSHPQKSVRCGVKEYRNRVDRQALEVFEGHPKLVLILNIFLWLCRHNQRGYVAPHSRPLKARNVHGGGAVDAKGCQLSDHHAFQYRLFLVLQRFLHPVFFLQASRTREARGSSAFDSIIKILSPLIIRPHPLLHMTIHFLLKRVLVTFQ